MTIELAYSVLCIVSRNVLVKGGDLPSSSDAVDIFFNGMPEITLLPPCIHLLVNFVKKKNYCFQGKIFTSYVHHEYKLEIHMELVARWRHV